MAEKNISIHIATVAETKDAKQLQGVIEDLGKAMKKVGGREATKLRDEMAGIIKALRSGSGDRSVFLRARDEMKRVAEQCDKLKDFSDAISVSPLVETLETAGVRAGAMEKILLALGTKIGNIAAKAPMIGKAFASAGSAIVKIPVQKLLLGIGAAVTLVKKLFEEFDKAKDIAEKYELKNLEDGIRHTQDATENWIESLDLALLKEKQIVEVMQEQKDASLAIAKAQTEANKAKELAAARTDEERAAIENRYARIEAGLGEQTREAAAERQQEQFDLEIKEKERKIAANRRKIADANDAADKYRRAANGKYDETSVWSELNPFAVVGLAKNRNEERIEKAEELTEKANAKSREVRDLHSENSSLEADVEQLKKKKKLAAETSKAEIAAERAKNKADADKRELEERRRKEQTLHAHGRELAVEGRDISQTESDVSRTNREYYEGIGTRMATAKAERDRWSAEEAELEARVEALREKAEANMNAGRGVTTEDAAELSEATEDWKRARERRIQEEAKITDLQHTQHERMVESREQRRLYSVEDEEFNRSTLYGRASYKVKMDMEERRLAEETQRFEAAMKRLADDTEGRTTLSPEQRKIAERERDEARARIVQSRQNLTDLKFQGDKSNMEMIAAGAKAGSRLASLGLGGGGMDWNRKTADNTGRLVKQSAEQLKILKGTKKELTPLATWR